MRRPEPTLGRAVASYVFGLPNQRAFRTAAAVGLPLVLSLFLFKNGMDQKAVEQSLMPPPALVEVVTVVPTADLPLVLPDTISKVADREFVWREGGGVWVQRGLEGEVPEFRVSAQSPQGRELLERYSDLGFLMAEGARVVLRYRLETVELSQGV